MTIPLVIQAVNVGAAEYKDAQRRFVAQALLSTTDARQATAATVGTRAFVLYLYSTGLESSDLSGPARVKMLNEFIQTASELMATKATAPAISPHVIQFLGGLIAWWLWRRFG